MHKKIRIPTESAMEVMDALGKLEGDTLEFIDLNKENLEAKKNFAEMIKRCEEMDRKITYKIYYKHS